MVSDFRALKKGPEPAGMSDVGRVPHGKAGGIRGGNWAGQRGLIPK